MYAVLQENSYREDNPCKIALFDQMIIGVNV